MYLFSPRIRRSFRQKSWPCARSSLRKLGNVVNMLSEHGRPTNVMNKRYSCRRSTLVSPVPVDFRGQCKPSEESGKMQSVFASRQHLHWSLLRCTQMLTAADVVVMRWRM